MARVFVGMGSNANRVENIHGGLRAMRERFGRLTLSPVYESRAVGFEGDNFYNLVVAFDTDMDPARVAGELRDIERAFGRVPGMPKHSPRTLDLDLLLYGDLCRRNGVVDVPRGDIEKFPFVLWPLADIGGDVRHPESGESIADLRARFEGDGDQLWLADVDLQLQE